jgi:hypothetical protein
MRISVCQSNYPYIRVIVGVIPDSPDLFCKQMMLELDYSAFGVYAGIDSVPQYLQVLGSIRTHHFREGM